MSKCLQRRKKAHLLFRERNVQQLFVSSFWPRDTELILKSAAGSQSHKKQLKARVGNLEKLARAGYTTYLKTWLIIGHGTWRGFHKLLTWDVDITAGSIEQQLPLWTGTPGPRWVEQTHEVTGHSQAGIRCCGDRTKRAVRQKETRMRQSDLKWEQLFVYEKFVCSFSDQNDLLPIWRMFICLKTLRDSRLNHTNHFTRLQTE